jgi:hypothetical protein
MIATKLDHLVRTRPVVLLAPVCAALVVLLVAMAREQWFPTGDLGQAELHVRGFLRHPPLVGAAGRIGTITEQGSHPGPSLWVILYPTYLLFGESAFGMMAGMVVLHTAAIIGTVVVARRVGGVGLAVAVAVVLAVIVRSSGPEFFVEPWNPWAAVLPFACFVLLIAGVLAGHRWMFFWAVLVGSHCVQAHVGYVVLVGALCSVALVALMADLRGGARPEVLKVVAATAGGFAVAWLPPVVDQIRRDPGNFTLLWREFASPSEESIGWWTALRGFAGEVNLVGGWVVGPGHLPTDDPWWPGFLAMVGLLVAAGVIAARRTDRAGLSLVVTLGISWFIGLFAISRIFGEFYPYVIRWSWVLAGLAFAVSAWIVVREALGRMADRRNQFERIGLVAVVAVVTVVSTTAAVAFGRSDLPSLRDSRLVGGVVPEIIDDLDPSARHLIRWHDPASLGGVGYGVLLELERRGFAVGVDVWGAAAALPHRVYPEETVQTVLWVVTGDVAVETMRRRDDAVELGFFDQRTDVERARSVELRSAIEQRLVEIGRPDLIDTLDTQYGLAPFVIGDAPVPQDVKDLAGDLNTLRYEIAVFAVTPFSPLYGAERLP